MRTCLLLLILAACGGSSSGPETPDGGTPDASDHGGCESLSCTDPPPPVCLADGMTLRTSASPGSCQDGTCSYGHVDTVCQDGCADGACLTDLCQGVTCNSPPPPVCLADGMTLRSSASPGSCADGTCSYAHVDSVCAAGCQGGACVDACAGVTCASPPPPTCLADGITLRTSASPGTCAGGSCSYSHVDTVCADACIAGACMVVSCGATDCVHPPGSRCVNAQELGEPVDVGTCSGGLCSYAEDVARCTLGCAASRCAPGSWLVKTVDPLRTDYANLALDAAGNPTIVHLTDGGTLTAETFGPTGWQRQVIDPLIGYPFQNPYVAIDASGGTHVAYTERVNQNARYAYRAPGATAFSVEFVVTAGNALVTGMALAPDGSPIVAVVVDSELRILRRSGGAWTVTHTLAPGVSMDNLVVRMGLDGSGRPVLALAYFTVRNEVMTVQWSRLGLASGSTFTTSALPSLTIPSDVEVDPITGAIDVLLGLRGRLQVAHRDPAGTWSTADLALPASEMLQGVLARAADGTLHAFHLGPSGGLVQAVRAPGQSSWTSALIEDSDEWYAGEMMGAVVDTSGQPRLVVGTRTPDRLFYLRPAP